MRELRGVGELGGQLCLLVSLRVQVCSHQARYGRGIHRLQDLLDLYAPGYISVLVLSCVFGVDAKLCVNQEIRDGSREMKADVQER